MAISKLGRSVVATTISLRQVAKAETIGALDASMSIQQFFFVSETRIPRLR